MLEKGNMGYDCNKSDDPIQLEISTPFVGIYQTLLVSQIVCSNGVQSFRRKTNTCRLLRRNESKVDGFIYLGIAQLSLRS